MFRRLHNILFLKKYPFYKMYNILTGKFMGYKRTWYDNIPKGWRKSFGKELSKELQRVAKTTGELETLRITDIKEKWWCLEISVLSATDDIYNVLDRYSMISTKRCIHCGKQIQFDNLREKKICDKCYAKFKNK